jgi:hypothetical protein
LHQPALIKADDLIEASPVDVIEAVDLDVIDPQIVAVHVHLNATVVVSGSAGA